MTQVFNRFSLFFTTLFVSHFACAEITTARTALTSIAPTIVKKSVYAGPIDPNEKITFTLWLKFRNQVQMDQLAHAIYDPHSARYHHFMTTEEYQNIFSPTVETKETLQHYLQNKGLQAEIVFNTIQVTGTAKAVEALLNIRLSHYRYADKLYYGTTSEPSLPVAIAESIQSVTGLTNIPRFHGFVSEQVAPIGHPSQPVHEIKYKLNGFSPMAIATDTSLNGFSPSTLQTVYQLSSIAPIHGTKIDGTGQTIVIVDETSVNSPSQVMADANQYGGSTLPKLTAQNFAAVDSIGSPCTTQCTGTGSGTETGLDVESSHTIAPGANIVLALGDFQTTLANVINILIANNHTIGGFSNAHVISNSWGDSETANESLEPYLQSASMSGISVDASSGDCGDRASGTNCMKTTQASLIYPASSSYVTAVGATSLFVDANWNYGFELGWGNYFANSTNFHAGVTGGISQFYGPASWQSIISNFVAVGYTGTVGSNNKRAVPDIEMLGDPQTGLSIVVGGSQFVDGGTSLACPLFTAVLALSNQARAVFAGGQNPVGQAAPLLYNNYSAFVANNALNLITPPHQIISGATKPNSQQVTAGAPLSAFTIYHSFYQTFGWDSSLGVVENQFWNDQTGLGSPIVPNFVALVAGL